MSSFKVKELINYERIKDVIDISQDLRTDESSQKLDERYEAMTVQFAAYTALITQMVNSFAPLKLIIEGDDS